MRDTLCHMKTITIRELHSKTGHWVRKAAEHGEICITDNGQPVASLTPAFRPAPRPFFANPPRSKAFKRLEAAGKLRGGTDSTITISEDREDRSL